MKAPYTVLWTPPASLAHACFALGVAGEWPAVFFRHADRWAIVHGRSPDYSIDDRWALALRWEGRPCVFSRQRATHLLARHEEETSSGLDVPADFDPQAVFFEHHTGDLWCLSGLDGFSHTYTFVAPKDAPNAECTDGHTLDYSNEDTHEIECHGQPSDVDSALVTILATRLGGSIHIVNRSPQ